ncbi:Toxin mRNA interferase YgiU [Caballeronia sordidicola]|jgi:motility quorum-sensing regulator/GCU-specific mRNA interferase toxin|uniref:Toxin mRNA interferase YgiU n=1 Tax=Caballeronia sordidicola TaxID=196367 RepID=A0A242MZB8_CABSO|nr:Toxin mRNA interferase YgiU [Caballeronia sordidicola]
MEKSVPHCRLAIVLALLEAGMVRSTMSALSGAAAMGLTSTT